MSHVVALAVVFYYMIAILISDNFLGIHLMNGPSGTFFGFLIAVIVIEIGVTVGCDLRVCPGLVSTHAPTKCITATML